MPNTLVTIQFNTPMTFTEGAGANGEAITHGRGGTFTITGRTGTGTAFAAYAGTWDVEPAYGIDTVSWAYTAASGDYEDGAGNPLEDQILTCTICQQADNVPMAYDLFGDAAQALLTSRASDSGHTWDQPNGGSGVYFQSSIVGSGDGDAASLGEDAEGGFAVMDLSAEADFTRVEADLTTTWTGKVNQVWGVALFVADAVAGLDAVQCVVLYNGTTGAASLSIREGLNKTSNTFTELAASAGATLAAGGVSMKGAQITYNHTTRLLTFDLSHIDAALTVSATVTAGYDDVKTAGIFIDDAASLKYNRVDNLLVFE